MGEPSRPTALDTDRAVFMAAVHAALGRTKTVPPPAPPPAVDESIARLAGKSDDLVAMFVEAAEEVGMHVQRVQRPDVFDAVLLVLTRNDARRVVVGVSADEAIADRLSEAGIEVIDWHGPDGFNRQFDVDAGITDVHAALAETGTLICHSDPAHSRGLSLVPPIHVAIVRSSDILPDMIDYWALFKDKPNTDLPSSIAFITGPSKTADIEGVLIKGVHGPQDVHIVVVEDEG